MRVLLAVYDNDSFISCFPLGIAYLAAAARGRALGGRILPGRVFQRVQAYVSITMNARRIFLLPVLRTRRTKAIP